MLLLAPARMTPASRWMRPGLEGPTLKVQRFPPSSSELPEHLCFSTLLSFWYSLEAQRQPVSSAGVVSTKVSGLIPLQATTYIFPFLAATSPVESAALHLITNAVCLFF